MNKRQLFEALKDVSDDEELFVITREYDPEDDATWADNQTEILGVQIHNFKIGKATGRDIYIVINCNEFDG